MSRRDIRLHPNHKVNSSISPEKNGKEKGDYQLEPINSRSGKVILNTLCTLIQATSNINVRLQGVQNATAEIGLLRQEVIEMNKKIDRLIELVGTTPEGRSTFLKYFMS